MMDVFLTTIHRYHRINNWSDEFYFLDSYFIKVHNKTILKAINMQTVIDEMWYIVEYFVVNFSLSRGV